jgi:hypothetical protein
MMLGRRRLSSFMNQFAPAEAGTSLGLHGASGMMLKIANASAGVN